MKNIQIYTTNSSTDINSSITICSICNTVNCDSENKSLCNSEREFKFKRISFKYILNHRYFILIVFCITHLFIFSTYSILAPFYPIEARKKGVNGPIIGLVIGVFELSSVIFSPLIGKLITKVNSIVILATGIFFSAGCVILFGLVSQIEDARLYSTYCIILRIFEGFFSSSAIIAMFTISGLMYPQRYGTTIGILEAFSAFGLMIGAPVGGLLYKVGGFQNTFFIIGGSMIPICFIASIVLSRSNLKMHQEPTPFANKVSTGNFYLRFNNVIISIIITMSFCSTAFIDSILSFHLKKRFDLDELYIGLIFFIPPFTYCITAPFLGYIADKKPGLLWPFVFSGLIIIAISIMFCSPPQYYKILDSLPLLCIFLGFQGIGLGICFAATQLIKLEMEKIDTKKSLHNYGVVSGYINTFVSLGLFIGPLIGGFLIEKFSFNWSCNIFSFAVLLVNFFIFILYIWKNFKSTAPQIYNKVMYDTISNGTDSSITVVL